MTFMYFGYGSNMLIKKLKDRCPSAEKIEPTTNSQHMIRNHAFRFHKVSDDGSSKGDAMETKNADSIVYGVIFTIEEEEKSKLDKAEGLGYGYEEKIVDVIDEKTTEVITAVTYYATRINHDLEPYDWYKLQTVKGARDNNLPVDYIKKIEDMSSKPDNNEERRNRAELFLE